MRAYRAYFLEAGHFFSRREFEAADDATATSMAETLRLERQCQAIEVWDRERLVCRYDGQSKPASP